MKFYKVLNKDEVHMDMAYKTGFNKDIRGFEPSHNGGGIHFARSIFYPFWIMVLGFVK